MAEKAISFIPYVSKVSKRGDRLFVAQTAKAAVCATQLKTGGQRPPLQRLVVKTGERPQSFKSKTLRYTAAQCGLAAPTPTGEDLTNHARSRSELLVNAHELLR